MLCVLDFKSHLIIIDIIICGFLENDPLSNNFSVHLIRRRPSPEGFGGGSGRQKGEGTLAKLIHRFYAAANGGKDNSFVPEFRIR